MMDVPSYKWLIDLGELLKWGKDWKEREPDINVV